MSKLVLVIVGVVVIAAAIGSIVLVNWDIPPPTKKIQRVLPDASFPG
jgi:hypothetical protein